MRKNTCIGTGQKESEGKRCLVQYNEEYSNKHFCEMTRPGFEPWSVAQHANTLPTTPQGLLKERPSFDLHICSIIKNLPSPAHDEQANADM